MLSTINPHRCSVRVTSMGPAHLPLDDADFPAPRTVLTKVLVVDDETDLADLCSMLLSAHGLEVVTAYSAQEALNQLEQDPQIDAVVSDIVMPGMNGLQLAEAVRGMYPRVKVVLVSGYTAAKEFHGLDKSYLFAQKPYKITTILALLHT